MGALGWLILVMVMLILAAPGLRVGPPAPTRRRGHRHGGPPVKLLTTASQINKLPVVTVRSGEDVAEVRDVIYSQKRAGW
jgi:hypothetical protein